MKKICFILSLLLVTISLTSCDNFYKNIKKASSGEEEFVLNDGWYSYSYNQIEKTKTQTIYRKFELIGEFDFQNKLNEDGEKINSLFPNNNVLLKQYQSSLDIATVVENNEIKKYEQDIFYDGQNYYENVVDYALNKEAQYKKTNSNHILEVQIEAFDNESKLKDGYTAKDDYIIHSNYSVDSKNNTTFESSLFIFNNTHKLIECTYTCENKLANSDETTITVTEKITRTNKTPITVSTNVKNISASFGIKLYIMSSKELFSYFENALKAPEDYASIIFKSSKGDISSEKSYLASGETVYVYLVGSTSMIIDVFYYDPPLNTLRAGIVGSYQGGYISENGVCGTYFCLTPEIFTVYFRFRETSDNSSYYWFFISDYELPNYYQE